MPNLIFVHVFLLIIITTNIQYLPKIIKTNPINSILCTSIPGL